MKIIIISSIIIVLLLLLLILTLLLLTVPCFIFDKYFLILIKNKNYLYLKYDSISVLYSINYKTLIYFNNSSFHFSLLKLNWSFSLFKYFIVIYIIIKIIYIFIQKKKKKKKGNHLIQNLNVYI